VWERLRAIGHPLRGCRWTSDEHARLREMAGEYSITQIAHELGRPYGSVADKISVMGLSGLRKREKIALPRGAGFDKQTTLHRIRELEKYPGSVRQYARANSIRLDPFIKAIQRHNMDWWNGYVRKNSDLPVEKCAYCGAEFYPMTKKQKTCSRRCQAHHRTDQQYFGGKRKGAIGMAEGVCQLCGQAKKSLSAHHMRGKENDPENEALIALCAGCHRVVGILAGLKFTDTAEGWEALINLAMILKVGNRKDLGGVHTCVDIELLTPDEVAESDMDEVCEATPERAEIRVEELT